MPDTSIENIYPLTPLQEGILFHSLRSPNSGVFIDQIHFELSLKYDAATQLQNHWIKLVERHQALRTAFIWKDISHPVQVVKHCAEIDWRTLSYRDLDKSQQQTLFNELLKADRKSDFDLSRAPLMRHALIEVDHGRYRLLWTFHHLILDGWSVANLLNELQHQLKTSDGLPPKPRAFVDHVNFLQNKKNQQQSEKRFWANYLKGLKVTTRLRPQTPSSPGKFCLQENDFIFTQGDQAKITQFARTQRLSLNTLFHAAWSWTLMSQLQRQDIVYGATFSGRDPELEGVENMIGVFINSLPVRIIKNNNSTVFGWLQSLQKNLNQLIPYQHCSLSDIKRYSELLPQEDLFESLLVVENYPINSDSDDSTAFKNITHIEQSNHPCVLLVLPGQALHLRMIVDGKLISSVQCSQWLEQIHHILTHLDQWVDLQIGDVQSLPENQISKLLRTDAPSSFIFDTHKPIHEFIEASPSGFDTALIDQHGQTRYCELNQFSSCLGEHLIEQGIQANDLIAIVLPRCRRHVACMLGVLKSGAAYVIIDPENPDRRTQAILEQIKPKLIVCSQQINLSAAFENHELLDIDSIELSASAELQDASIFPAVDNESPAYVLFTSGSTGIPKGVKITHGNLLYSTLVRDSFYPQAPQAFLLLSPLHFDSSVAGIYWTLVNGGKLIISENRIEQDMHALIDLIDKHQVTHTLCLPTLYELVLRTAQASSLAHKLQSLNTVIVAGEALNSPDLLKLHRELLLDTRLFNEYGPTEATVWCCAYDATYHDPSRPVPIGKAIPGTEIMIVDQHNHLVPEGASGELCVAGPGVSAGYLNLEQQTAAQFIQLDIDLGKHTTVTRRVYKTGDLVRFNYKGEIEFLGRSDDQVKIRGHRFEPGEIERALLEEPAIAAAVVLSIEQPGEQTQSVSKQSIQAMPSTEADMDRWLLDQLDFMNAEQAGLFLDELTRLEQSGKV